MAKKSRPRRNGALQYAQSEFALIDCHTSRRVRLLNPMRFFQLVGRGVADQVAPTVARLKVWLSLASDALAENGEPRLRAANGEATWPHDTGCPTGKICDMLWQLNGKMSFTLAEVEQAIAARQSAIFDETLLWGLPEMSPLVLTRQFE